MREWVKQHENGQRAEYVQIQELERELKRLSAILQSHAAAPCYGLDNIRADVRETLVCGRNRIRRLMRQMGVKSQRKRRYKATTNSAHKLPAAPNRVKGHPPKAPDKVWVCDITYIHTDAGFLYLATVKDLFTREIVGFASSARIDAALTTAALCKAVEQRKPEKGLICHSDRGVQYCCHEYRSLLEGYGFLASKSRKGNPYEREAALGVERCRREFFLLPQMRNGLSAMLPNEA